MEFLKKLLRWSSIGMGALFGLYLIAALVMILLPGPKPSAQGSAAADVEQGVSSTYDVPITRYTMRDGVELTARTYPSESQQIVLLVHGVTGSSDQLATLTEAIRETTGASVYALDLRGHGGSGGKRGSIDYIGQYEDDLADTIAAIREAHPDHELIVMGYSMGGAVVLRYAAQDHGVVDGYVLIAPNMGINAPTARPEPETPRDPEIEPFLELHVPRIVGIALLGDVGSRVFGGMPTMFFNLPDTVVNTYSYRAMMNSTPEDYQAAFQSINVPLLVVVGRNDETMLAEAFPPMVSGHSDGVVRIVDGETHGSILDSPEAVDVLQEWLHRSSD